MILYDIILCIYICIYIIHYQIMCMYIYIIYTVYIYIHIHSTWYTIIFIKFPCSEIDHQKLACALCPLSNRPSWEGHRIPIWGCGQRDCKVESFKLKPQRQNGGNPQSHTAPPLQPSVVHWFTDRRASNHRNCSGGYTVDRLANHIGTQLIPWPWTTHGLDWATDNEVGPPVVYLDEP